MLRIDLNNFAALLYRICIPKNRILLTDLELDSFLNDIYSDPACVHRIIRALPPVASVLLLRCTAGSSGQVWRDQDSGHVNMFTGSDRIRKFDQCLELLFTIRVGSSG